MDNISERTLQRIDNISKSMAGIEEINQLCAEKMPQAIAVRKQLMIENASVGDPRMVFHADKNWCDRAATLGFDTICGLKIVPVGI